MKAELFVNRFDCCATCSEINMYFSDVFYFLFRGSKDGSGRDGNKHHIEKDAILFLGGIKPNVRARLLV